jgi:uncharacterized membrane protein (UPF0136 family)
MGVGLLLIAYGALLGFGGLLASKRQNNRIPLVIGGFSGVVLVICGALSWLGFLVGAYAGLGWTLLMTLLFALRYRKTKQIRPAGIMLVFSLIVLVVGAYLLFF